MKKFMIRFVLALIVLIAGISVALEFINWNQFKPQIKEQVYKMTGRALDIDGDLKLRLLPAPRLIVQEIKLANAQGGKDPFMIGVKSLKVGVALFPLLSKQLKVTKVILDSPIIHIEKFAEGGNWVFPEISTQNASPEAETNPGALKKSSSFQVSVDRAEISNGTVTYRDGKDVTTVQDMQISMSLESLEGAFDLEGTLKVKGDPYAFKLHSKGILSDKPIPVMLAVSQPLGEVSFDGNIDVTGKSASGHLKGSANLQEKISFATVLKASEESITLSNVSLQAGVHKGTGDIHISLTPAVSLKVNLTGLPGETSVDFQGFPDKDTAKGTLFLHSKNLYQLLGIFGIDVKALQKKSIFKISSGFSISPSSGYRLQGFLLSLNDAILKGDVSVMEKNQTYQASMDLSTNSLDTLLKLADVKANRPLGAAKLKGTLSGSLASMKVDQTLSLLNGSLTVTGDLSNITTNLTYNLALKASHPNLAQLLGDSKKPSQALILSTRAKGSLKQVDLSQLNLSVGSVKIMGAASYSMGARSFIKADLSVPQGNLMDIMGGGAQAAHASSSTTASSGLSKKEHSSQKSSSARWSREPINIAFLKTTDMDIHLKANDLSLKKIPIKNVTLSLKLDKGNLDFSKKAHIAEGILTVRASASIADAIKTNIQFHLNDVSLTQLSSALADFKDVRGKGNIEFIGETHGRSEYDLISNLKGKASFSTKDAAIQGWDMKSLGNSIGSLQGLTKSLTFDKMMGQAKDTRKETKITLTGTVGITQGIASSNDIKLQGDGISANGKGTVNLPQWKMDSTADLRLTGLDPNHGIPAYARGPLDNLSYGMDTIELMKYVYSHFLKGTLEKVLDLKNGNPLGKLLGIEPSKKSPSQNGGTPSQAPQKGNDSPQEQVGKAIEGVLGKLLGN